MAVVALRDQFRITIAEASALALLARGGIVEPARIRDVYCDSPETPVIEARQFVKRVRKKAPVIRIITHYAIGYELDPQSVRAVRQVMQSAEHNSRGGAGEAQGEGEGFASPSIPSSPSRDPLSRAYASPAKQHRTSGAALQQEKEL